MRFPSYTVAAALRDAFVRGTPPSPRGSALISPGHHYRSACMLLQSALCAGQSAFWHALPQYWTDLHPLHSCSLPLSSMSAVTPHPAHCRTLRPPRRAGAVPMRGLVPPPSPKSCAPDGCSSLELARAAALFRGASLAFPPVGSGVRAALAVG
jgi:hypothetical protein